MDNRLPYYMTYPMPQLYEEDRSMRRDLDYMKSIYPKAAKRLIPYVEEECDRMEYSGSMMYDEYPDQLQLRMMCRRILRLPSAESHYQPGRPAAWKDGLPPPSLLPSECGPADSWHFLCPYESLHQNGRPAVPEP